MEITIATIGRLTKNLAMAYFASGAGGGSAGLAGAPGRAAHRLRR